MRKIVLQIALSLFAIAAIISCDDSINQVGSDFLGIDSNGIIQNEEFPIITYSEATGAVQTNGFGSQPFGYYVDPIYGSTTYNFVTALSLQNIRPSFSSRAVVLDSVVLSIPFFSTRTGVQEGNTENGTYRVDSLYRSTENESFGLQIYENKYFLNTLDPNELTSPARYYSNDGALIESQLDAPLYANTNFQFDTKETRLTTGSPVTVSARTPPSIRIALPTPFWKNKIIDNQGSDVLSTASAFNNFFRGLYFKVNSSKPTSNYTHLNLTDARVILYYKSFFVDVNDSNNNGDRTEELSVNSSFNLEFEGARATFITNNFTPAAQAAIANPSNTTTGSNRLYLKGGEGSLGAFSLFGPNATATIQRMRDEKWLINDAYIDFYVDQAPLGVASSGRNLPERIFVYNLDDNTILADYLLTNAGAGINNNVSHLGRLERVTPNNLDTNGVKYRIRLNNHIRQIIAGNIENVRLGIGVSLNPSVISSGLLRNTPSILNTNRIPTATAISHEGIVIHGNLSTSTAADGTALKPTLKIFYTKSN